MAKVLVALLRFSAKQQKEILQKVDEQVSQVSGPIYHTAPLTTSLTEFWQVIVTLCLKPNFAIFLTLQKKVRIAVIPVKVTEQ